MKRLWWILPLVLTLSCAHLTTQQAFTPQACAQAVARSIGMGLESSYAGITVIVAAPVDASTFRPGDFGLAMQELLIGALVAEQVNVLEVQLREVPYITCQDGLMALSRDAARLKDEQRAGIIVVGTYVVQRGSVALNVRAVDFTTSDVITASTVNLSKTASVRDLLRGCPEKRLYER